MCWEVGGPHLQGRQPPTGLDHEGLFVVSFIRGNAFKISLEVVLHERVIGSQYVGCPWTTERVTAKSSCSHKGQEWNSRSTYLVLKEKGQDEEEMQLCKRSKQES